MLRGGNRLYQTSAASTKVKWKALHFNAGKALLSPICIMYLLRCFSKSPFPSYLGIFGA